MSIFLKSGRQEVIAAEIEFSHEDVASGVSTKAVNLPTGAIVVGGFLAISTAFNSSESDTIDLGGVPDESDYADDVDAQAVGVTPLEITGEEVGPDGNVYVTHAAAGNPATAGSARLVVLYIVKGRAAFSHGEDGRPKA